MQYCPKCRLNIRGEKAGCPLCGGRLAGDPEPGGFPVLEKRRFSHMSVVKVATFCCLSMFIILMAAEILCDFKLAWVPFVVLVLLIVWGDIMVGVYFRNNLIRRCGRLPADRFFDGLARVVPGLCPADWISDARVRDLHRGQSGRPAA